jgi:hypothetical protein
LAPPRKIGLLSQIRKRFFWPSNSLLDETELIAEGNKKLSIAFSLEERKDKNAREIVLSFFDLYDMSITFEK